MIGKRGGSSRKIDLVRAWRSMTSRCYDEQMPAWDKRIMHYTQGCSWRKSFHRVVDFGFRHRGGVHFYHHLTHDGIQHPSKGICRYLSTRHSRLRLAPSIILLHTFSKSSFSRSFARSSPAHGEHWTTTHLHPSN